MTTPKRVYGAKFNDKGDLTRAEYYLIRAFCDGAPILKAKAAVKKAALNNPADFMEEKRTWEEWEESPDRIKMPI